MLDASVGVTALPHLKSGDGEDTLLQCNDSGIPGYLIGPFRFPEEKAAAHLEGQMLA